MSTKVAILHPVKMSFQNNVGDLMTPLLLCNVFTCCVLYRTHRTMFTFHLKQLYQGYKSFAVPRNRWSRQVSWSSTDDIGQTREVTAVKGHQVSPISPMHVLLIVNRLLDSQVVECWHRMREVPVSIPSQGPRHTKDVIKMVPVIPLFNTQRWKGKILAFSQEIR